MKTKITAAVVVLAVLVVYLSTYIVSQGQRAILFKLGQIQQADIKPGLHFKIPLFEHVRRFDARLRTLDSQPQSFVTSDKKEVRVGYFVKWRIANFEQYDRATRGDTQTAQLQLAQILQNDLRGEFAKLTLAQAVSGERSKVVAPLQAQAEKSAKKFGVQIVDVRLKGIELPQQVATSVYKRMEAQRARIAADLRAQGKTAAARIRANADRQRTVILAKAYRESQILRGQGDAQAAQIYAKAYDKNPAFYEFYRSLEAYRHSFTGKNSLLVLKPGSQFLQYFNNSQGASGPAK